MRINYLFWVTLVLFIAPLMAWSQSIAHMASKYTIIDPAYNADSVFPAPGLDSNKVKWLYGPSEFECYRLQLAMRRKDSAKLKVNYPGMFHKPYDSARFRLRLKKAVAINTISFRTIGSGWVAINGKLFKNFDAENRMHIIKLTGAEKILEIEVGVITTGDVPALLVTTPKLFSFNQLWQWKSGNCDWQFVSTFYQNKLNLPPHQYEDPYMAIRPGSMPDGTFDFGRELFGYVNIKANQCPGIFVGESIPEVENSDTRFFEQSLAVKKISDGVWRSEMPLAFRYVRVVGNLKNGGIWANAIFHPVRYKGAFSCSDSLLTRIWMNSAYTLHLCMHDFLLDGIKRDRLPWAGDMAMSILSDAYTFYDPEIVRRSLVALGRSGIKEQDINGIVDYSLWWVISQDLFQLYFGDKEFLKRNWNHIKAVLTDLDKRTDKNGFLSVKGNGWVFIDWVSQPKWTALQILWWWAKKSGARLAARMGDGTMERKLSEEAGQLKSTLRKVAWNTDRGAWSASMDTGLPTLPTTRHPNFLAVISGLSDNEQYPGIGAVLTNHKIKSVGTPYMEGFEMMALAKIGAVDSMIGTVKSYWGGMIAKGATSFWEAYDPAQQGNSCFSFYGRPFAKSLCHAWSAGPAAFLPAGLLGLQPLEDGWRRFTMNPHIGRLKYVNVAVPTPHGHITVDIFKEEMRVKIPYGTCFYWKGKNVSGPNVVIDKL